MAYISTTAPQAFRQERAALADRLKALGFVTAASNIRDGTYVADFAAALEACDRFAADRAVFRDFEMGKWCRAPVTLPAPKVVV